MTLKWRTMINDRDKTENTQGDKKINIPPCLPLKRGVGVMSIDKILFACVSSYLLGVVLWILCHEQLWSGQARTLAETGHSSVADAQFIDYLRRSLFVIEDKQQQSQSPLPSQTLQPSPSNQLNNVYVPIATPSQPTLVIPAPPPVVTSYFPLPSPLPSRVPRPSQPVKASKSVIPPPPPRERPKTVPTLGQTLEQNPIAQFPSPKQSTANFGYSLVGLMESGDKSAALFEINGVTQRINLGEEIGTSGWNLLSISDQQAVLSKGGEIQSVYVGNKL